LQIRAPGRRAAAGPATGKTGTPLAQTAGTAFTVTVNAVDANWNLVSTNDTVAITASDPNAALPANTALSLGSKVLSLTLKTAGAATVTASDVTHSSITNNTSPSVTVNPGAYTKLQLLVPGETEAPGTATGKTGTPFSQNVGAVVSLDVNAVDANWNLVTTVTNVVAITSSDSLATLPPSVALSAGTQSFSL